MLLKITPHGNLILINTPSIIIISPMEMPISASLLTLLEEKSKPTTFSYPWMFGKDSNGMENNTLMLT